MPMSGSDFNFSFSFFFQVSPWEASHAAEVHDRLARSALPGAAAAPTSGSPAPPPATAAKSTAAAAAAAAAATGLPPMSGTDALGDRTRYQIAAETVDGHGGSTGRLTTAA